MDWIRTVNDTIKRIDAHLEERDILRILEKELYLSISHLQKGFKAITGVTITEYFSSRKLFCAALDIASRTGTIAEIAEKYHYDSYDAFFKAFKKFHGCTPSEIKEDSSKIRRYPPLQVKVTVQGGDELVFKEITIESFTIYGEEYAIDFDKREKEAPQLFFMQVSKMNPSDNNELFSIITDNGSYFTYFLGTTHNHIKGSKEYIIPAGTWLVFECEGKHPEALRDTRNRLFNEFLVVHHEYELVGNVFMEHFSYGDYKSHYYKSELWVPIKHND